MDWEVNEESRFEDKIYPVEDCEVTKNNDEIESAEGTVTEFTDDQTAWIGLCVTYQYYLSIYLLTTFYAIHNNNNIKS